MNVAIIPARGGSKGIRGKNIRSLHGLPLVGHSILQALNSRSVDQVFVTTDDPTIASAARNFGAEIVSRPSHLASDTATSEEALLHALDVIESQVGPVTRVVFLQATSPIRTSRDIDGAINHFIIEEADSLLSVAPSHRFLWARGERGEAISLNYDFRERPRRQDMAPQFVENGSIYIFKPEILRSTNNRLGGKVVLYEMDELSSAEIDTEDDWQLVEALMRPLQDDLMEQQ